MEPWIFMLQFPGFSGPIEHWLSHYRSAFDAWEDGGVRGLVIGRLYFTQEDGTTITAFKSDPKIYESFGLTAAPPQPRDPEKEKRLYALLDDAASRNWHVMVFSSIGVATSALPVEEDPYGVVPYAASLQDLTSAYPQIHGHIIDGPGENPYELAFHHGGELFEIQDHHRKQWPHLGVDVDRAERGMAHLRRRFHELTPSAVRYKAQGGMLAALDLFDVNEDALYWLRARREATLGYLAAVRRQVDKLDRKVELGGIPRTATFSSLTGQDYQQLGRYLDYVFPKHYFWHRGFDGMYGTIARWVKQLSQWNPLLTEEDCFAVVKSLFGIELPGITTLTDMERGFPDEFFSRIVHGETLRALEAVGDPDKVIAWVSTGRSPHGGDSMTTYDLQRMLIESQRAGLKRFIFHSTEELGAAEWRVISGMFGNLWNEDPTGYWPVATEKPDTWNGGRKPITSD